MLKNIIHMPPKRLALLNVLLGPLAMMVFYCYELIVHGGTAHRGLFSYWSATVGDLVFISIALFLLQKAVLDALAPLDVQWRTRLRLERTWLHALILALVLTVSIHLAWMLDPTTESNWTFHAGMLNFYGYWHAVYFWLVLAWMIYFVVMLVKLTHLTPLAPMQRGADFSSFFENYGGALCAMLCYVYLLVGDNSGSATAAVSKLTSLIPLALVGVFFLYLCMEVWSLIQTGQERREFWKILLMLVALTGMLVFSLWGFRTYVPNFEQFKFGGAMLFGFIPLMTVVNYFNNVYALQKKSTAGGVALLGGATVLLFILALMAITLNFWEVRIAVEGGRMNFQMDKIFIKMFAVIVGWCLLFLLVLLISKAFTEDKHLTDESGHLNFIQNGLAFGLICIVGILYFIAIENKETLKDFLASNDSSFLKFFPLLVSSQAAAVFFVIKRNFDHLSQEIKGRMDYFKGVGIYSTISIHIWVLMIAYAFALIFMNTWLFAEFVELTPIKTN